MLLAIDLGNTAIKVAHEDAFGALRVFRADLSERPFGDLIGAALDGSPQSPFGSICAVASVAPQYDPDLEDALSAYGLKPRFLTAENAPGIRIEYDTPATLGADRIANALFASDRYEGSAVVVDFGTATKLDAVNFSGAFVGGAILPGLRMMVQSLFRGTAKLPEIEIVVPKTAIGKSTRACLESGTVLALSKAVEGLLAEFRLELGEAPMIVSTGGLADTMAPLCPSIGPVEPNLTLEGLLIAARQWASEG